MKKEIFQLMHQCGKLTSCDSNKPHKIDELFVEKLLKLFENGKRE